MGSGCYGRSSGYVRVKDPLKQGRRLELLPPALLGFLVQVALQNVTVLALMKYLHDSAVPYKLIASTLDQLYISQPSNPLAQFLFWNKSYLLGTSRSFFTKAILASTITALLIIGGFIVLTVYEVAGVLERRKSAFEKPLEQKRKRKFAVKAAQFTLGFAVGTVLAVTVLLIPFFLLPSKKPESVLNFILKFHNVRDNPLAEILKGIVKETFKDSVLFEKYTTKIEACLLAVFFSSIALFCIVLTFLLVSALKEIRSNSVKEESPSQKSESATSISLESPPNPQVLRAI
ncbi:hypothetical protein GP480_03535 [Neorickettsia findlayensis]|uniref:Uncharacterized protein n=2 Tax=Neorickettsia findlayensis TaxID=2686014 RepID=A0A6P1GBC6_9RICK|nr:hypothetical protein GP480_03535 [Neorickettsia findlayensis]